MLRTISSGTSCRKPPSLTSRLDGPSSARRRPYARSTARGSAPISIGTISSDMVVAAAGAVDHHAVVAEVERRFASFAGPRPPTSDPARFVGGSRIETRDLEQAHIALGMHGLPHRDPNLYSLQVF